MKKMTMTGKTIEEAVQAGLAHWNVTEDRVEVKVIEEPAKGLFGLFGAKEAVVELTLVDDPNDAGQKAEAFLEKIFANMGLDISIDQIENEHALILNLSGPELAPIIGRRGQTLDALQYLVNIVANRRSDQRRRIILDAENFRARREKTLQQLALRLAQRVIKTGTEVMIEPMPASERKIIHAYLQNHPKVKTYSKGEEPYRRVVIILK